MPGLTRRRAADDAAPLAPAEVDGLFAALPTAAPLLLAVSGGPDSTALLHAAADWAARHGHPTPRVATVDHGVRPEARAEAAAVAAAAAARGLAHHLLAWTEGRPARVSQEAARRARYRLLDGCASAIGAAALVTAHTRDDQAETVLMRLAAGSGIAGLAGMRPATQRGFVLHHRPFLPVPKARLLALCRAGGWPFAADLSNDDPRFARTRWRQLAPRLAAEGMDAARLGRLAERAARAEAALDDLAGDAFLRLASRDGEELRMSAVALAAEPAEIALRVLGRALLAVGGGGGKMSRLERLEAAWGDIAGAVASGRSLRRTLSGCLLALDGGGVLAVLPEPPRRGGRAPVTAIVAHPPPSLGRGEARP